MGQYYKVVNLDKKQYLEPHGFGNGAKLMEFASGGGTMMALGVLLADGNGCGGGDLDSSDPLVGSWAGDRIVIAGDYADRSWNAENPSDERTLYQRLDEDGFKDISADIRRVLVEAGESV
jgi:hypothetical protein